jgi:two-component system, sensor histidine kinase ChiS
MKRQMKQIAGFLRIVFFIFVFLIFGCANVKTPLVAVNGSLDLSGWDFEKQGIVSLDGEWELYWRSLISPKQFSTSDVPVKTGYFSIPGYWNGYPVNGRPLSGDGYATFRLKVRVKPGGSPLAMRIEEQSSAYRLWVNGTLTMENGIVARQADTMKPDRTICIANLPTGAEHLDCVLQVSNFHLYNGGPYRGIALGTSDAINKRQSRFFTVDLLIFGILLSIGVYHLVFYFLRRKDLSLLYFGIFCLCWCLGIPFGSLSGRFMTLIFPDAPWYWLSRVELLTWYSSVPLFLMFFAFLFPQEFPSKVTRFAQVMAATACAFVLLVPSKYVNATEAPYSAFSMAMLVYVFWRLVCAVRRGRSEAGLMLAGFIFFLIATTNDILFMSLVIYSVYLTTLGVTVMIIFQSFALARLHARSFTAVEALTEELQKKNIALSKLDKLKDEFLTNTSHELRTPLNGMIGIAESLKSGVTGKLPEKTKENLALIVASGKRLSGLINDILDIARLKNKDIQLNQQPVDMRSLAETVLTGMQPLAAGKGLTLYNRVPATLPPVWADENRLQQILYNLVGNAVKFNDQGEIVISASGRGDLIEIFVTDTGIGIAEDKQEDIFKPFEQTDSSDKRAHGGTGLGLSITKQLVELHGGTISVQSSPNAGAAFRFTLPVARNVVANKAAPALTEAENDQPTPRLPSTVLAPEYEPTETPSGFEKPVQILVVDDDPVNLQVVANHLAFKNVKVITAASGRQAIEIIEKGRLPDLVLLDIMMPIMTGYEVLQWLRQRHTACELPVIFLTAKSSPGDLTAGFSHGANDYLVKPFLRDELVARVSSQLLLKNSYLTLRENLSLRKELQERKQIERELRILQHRLNGMLDSVNEALIAVNEAYEIAFCNRSCEALLGYDVQDILGRPAADMLWQTSDEETIAQLKREALCLSQSEGNRDFGVLALKHSDGTLCNVRVFVSLLDIEEESLWLLILRKDNGDKQNATKKISHSLGIIDSINRNRSRLQSIQQSLNGILPFISETQPDFLNELKLIDESLANAEKNLLDSGEYEDRRHLAADLMDCALTCWTEATGLTKADLAHQSRIWKVYTNLDGWERTQTLDRYLTIETFPKKPALWKVYKTVEFVLATCSKPSDLRNRLEILLSKLRSSR